MLVGGRRGAHRESKCGDFVPWHKSLRASTIDGKVSASAAPPGATDPHHAASQLHCTGKSPVYDKTETDRSQAGGGQRATGGGQGAKASVLGFGMVLCVAGLGDAAGDPRAQLVSRSAGVWCRALTAALKCLRSFRPAASFATGKHRDAAVLQHGEFAAINLLADATGHPLRHSASCPILLRSDSEQ